MIAASPRLISFREPNPKDRAKTLLRAHFDAYQVVMRAAQAAGWPVDLASPIGQMFHSGHRYAAYWQRRAEALTRQLHAALATDAIDDETRAAIVEGLTGGTRRDANLLTATEAALLEDFRAIRDSADRRMIARVIGHTKARQNGGRE